MKLAHMVACLTVIGGVVALPVAIPTPVSAQSTVLPQRGRVVFKGTHRATVVTPNRRRGSILGPLGGGTSREYQGTLTMDAEINGSTITIRVGGTGGMNASTYVGVIENGHCRVTGDKGAVFEGPCGPLGFSGEIRSGPNEGVSYKGNFSTIVVSVEDFDRQPPASRPSAVAGPRSPIPPASGDGAGSPPQVTGGVAELRSACNRGDRNAMLACTDLGLAYAAGRGVPKDPQLAAQYLARACDGNIMVACHNWGVISKVFDDKYLAYKRACYGGYEQSCKPYARIAYVKGMDESRDLVEALYQDSYITTLTQFEQVRASAISNLADAAKFDSSLAVSVNSRIAIVRGLKPQVR